MALPIQLQMYLKDQASSWKIRNWRQGTCNAFIYSEKDVLTDKPYPI